MSLFNHQAHRQANLLDEFSELIQSIVERVTDRSLEDVRKLREEYRHISSILDNFNRNIPPLLSGLNAEAKASRELVDYIGKLNQRLTSMLQIYEAHLSPQQYAGAVERAVVAATKESLKEIESLRREYAEVTKLLAGIQTNAIKKELTVALEAIDRMSKNIGMRTESLEKKLATLMEITDDIHSQISEARRALKKLPEISDEMSRQIQDSTKQIKESTAGAGAASVFAFVNLILTGILLYKVFFAMR